MSASPGCPPCRTTPERRRRGRPSQRSENRGDPSSTDQRSFDHSPWDFWRDADAATKSDRLTRQYDLTERSGYRFGEQCFVSAPAAVENDSLTFGDRTYVTAGAYLGGSLHAGRDCTINGRCSQPVQSSPGTCPPGRSSAATRGLRWRVPQPVTPVSDLTAFADRAREQAAVLERSRDTGARMFTDRPGVPATTRAHCDAVEIADLLLGRAPDRLPIEEQIERLRVPRDLDRGNPYREPLQRRVVRSGAVAGPLHGPAMGSGKLPAVSDLRVP